MNIFKSLTQDYLRLTVRSTRDTQTTIYERPGLWMSEQELTTLAGQLRTVAAKTLTDDELEYGAIGGARERFNAAIVTVVHDKDSNEPIAFNVLSWMPMELHGESCEVLHLGLVMIDPNVRNKGFSWVLYGLTCFLFFLRGGLRPIWVSNVTQVPAIYGLVVRNFSNVYPATSDAVQTFEHIALARQIMADHRQVFGVGEDAGYDEARSVITNAYTGGSDALKKTFEDCALYRDNAINEICQGALDYARGDDFLQIGQLTLGSARQFVFRDIPSQSLTALAATTAFLFTQSILMPFVQWLDGSRPYQNLRAEKSS